MTDEMQQAVELARRIVAVGDEYEGVVSRALARALLASVAEVERLTKERDDWRDRWTVTTRTLGETVGERDKLADVLEQTALDVDKARAEVERLGAVVEAVEHDITLVKQHREARERGGQHVGTGGPLAAANPSTLVYLERLVRDCRAAKKEQP